MVRRRWLIAQIAFVAMLGVLAFPGEGSAFAGVPIDLTATGPSPVVQAVSTLTYPFWINTDTVAHTVSFANGRCTVQVAPGAESSCPFSTGPGTYPYTVDGTAQGSVVVQLSGRTVTLDARSHKIAGGAPLTLRGRLRSFVPLPSPGPASPLIVLARPDRMHPFHRIAIVRPRISYPKNSFGVLRWHLRVHPRTRIIYIAEARSAPQTFQRAWSKPFRVHVSR
jgi:hypothetical protein